MARTRTLEIGNSTIVFDMSKQLIKFYIPNCDNYQVGLCDFVEIKFQYGESIDDPCRYAFYTNDGIILISATCKAHWEADEVKRIVDHLVTVMYEHSINGSEPAR